MQFEWDTGKAERNIRKHRVSFVEAATAFGDPFSRTIPDSDHSEDEDRWILLGTTTSGRLVVVVHVERADAIRLISARLASRSERDTYEHT